LILRTFGAIGLTLNEDVSYVRLLRLSDVA
jgi:hypothetical protein